MCVLAGEGCPQKLEESIRVSGTAVNIAGVCVCVLKTNLDPLEKQQAL